MIILKFGGTSVQDAKSILQSIAIIKEKKERKIVVFSAFGGVTNALLRAIHFAVNQDQSYKAILESVLERHLQIVQELFPELESENLNLLLQNSFAEIQNLIQGCYILGEITAKTEANILSYGEILSSKIIFQKLQESESKVAYVDSRELLKSDSNYEKANVNFEITNYIIPYHFDKSDAIITVVPGFIAEDSFGNTTTLGRGGSDYTAAILAAALDANHVEIWTDVSGIFTANPSIVKQALPIPKLSYKEAMELSHFGAKVLYAPTIQPVLQKNIPIWIKNTFAPQEDGTLIFNAIDNQNKNAVIGISSIENIALLTIEGSGLVGTLGASKRVFEAIAKQKINILFITQACSEHSICIGVLEKDSKAGKQVLQEEFHAEIRQGKIKSILLEENLSIIALVGDNMKNHQGLSGKMFSALGQNNINIRAIAQGSSENNISAVINQKDVNKAVSVLHERFFENHYKQLNLFICGLGNVGQKFLEQLLSQENYLKENLKLQIRVIGIATSTKMAIDADGISLAHWKSELEKGRDANSSIFLEQIEKLNLRNSIFIDCTASASISGHYASLLQKNIAVVTCNKIACADAYEKYKNLKYLSKKYNTPFLFETNVGAGLPIIDTLKNIVASGDKVQEIQAVLSGSLNFIFNHYSEDTSFYDVVCRAKEEGYTEPDPKIDLSGVDVQRKILILIRESGYMHEMEAIENIPFLPKDSEESTNIPMFMESLQNNEKHFQSLYQNAKEKDCRIKYVAHFSNGKAKVGLQYIPKEHPFYHLEGKDNIVLFYTDRYAEQPLLIKGAGAGAAVTASGIFADVIRIGNF